MTVTTSLPATGIIRSPGDQSVKLSAVLNNRIDTSATDSKLFASQSAQVDTKATAEQYPPLNLRVDSLSLAVAGASADTIDSSALQVSRILDQLQSLATRAALGGLSEAALEVLNGQFQALRLSINNVPPSPPQAVAVTELLEQVPGGADSALGQEAAAENLKVGGLNNAQTLLGELNIATIDAAKAALVSINGAQNTVEAQRVVIARVQEAIDFAAATTEGALANQEALRSTLSEGDLDGTSTKTSLVAALQAQSENARLAQTSRLPDGILGLLS